MAPKAKSGGIRDIAGVQRREAFMIDPRIITIEDGFNARNFDALVNKQRIASLYDSIKEVGVQTPVVVRYDGGKIILVDGETRLRATLQAIEDGIAIEAIPAITETVKSSESDRIASLISRNDSARLQPLEQGQVFARLLGFGWSEADIARKTGANPGAVSQYLKLYSSPERIQRLIEDQLVSATYALEVLRDHDEDEAVSILEGAVDTAVAEGKTRATKKHADKKEKKETPLYFQRTIVRSFIDQLVTIAVDTKYDSRFRRRIKDVLENGDVDWQNWKFAENEGD